MCHGVLVGYKRATVVPQKLGEQQMKIIANLEFSGSVFRQLSISLCTNCTFVKTGGRGQADDWLNTAPETEPKNPNVSRNNVIRD